jgi:hypothetical protein
MKARYDAIELAKARSRSRTPALGWLARGLGFLPRLAFRVLRCLEPGIQTVAVVGGHLPRTACWPPEQG